MQIAIQASGESALVRADVAHGWRKLTHTFGFCEEARQEIEERRILRVQAAIRARPNRFGSLLAEYPRNVYGLLNANWGRSELREEELNVLIDLPAVRRERLARSGSAGIYQPPIKLDENGRVSLWFSLLVVLGETVEYRDVLEWDVQFFMGGRPGGSRRH